MAIRLFLHAFQTIFGNFRQALRASLIPFGLLALLMIVATAALGDASGAVGSLVALLLVFASLFVFGFVAVSWHRFVLLEEEPSLQSPATERALPYVWKSVVLAFWLLLFLLPLVIILSLTGLALSPLDPNSVTSLGSFIGEIILGTVFGTLVLMYSLVLPARALDQNMTFGESRAHTSSLGINLPLLALLLVVFNSMVSEILVVFVGGAALLGLILAICLQWLVTMLGVSILTTLYGHLVEGRDLPS